MPGNWFIALSVPGDGWFSHVTEPPPGVRRFHPDDLHITVAFLGACGRSAAEEAFKVAPKWPLPAVDVTLGEVVAMGNPRRPNAFAALVRGGASELSAAILCVRDEMIMQAGARLEDRAPKPHVTVARPRRKASGPERHGAQAWAAGLELAAPTVRLSRLVLYTHSQERDVRLFDEVQVRELDRAPTRAPSS
jgi:RNA 2',3'-cyclic 3'-phosphodiesterase